MSGDPACRMPACSAMRGSALLLCLVLLSALTLLGLTAASDSQLQARINANNDRMQAARRNADAAVKWAEDWLFSLPGDARPVSCPDSCSTASPVIAEVSLPTHPQQLPLSWWTENGHLAGLEPIGNVTLDENLASHRARWIVAEIDTSVPEPGAFGPVVIYYRVLGRGSDDSGRQAAVSESIVARPWGNSAWSDPLPPGTAGTTFCRSLDPSPCGRLAWRRLR